MFRPQYEVAYHVFIPTSLWEKPAPAPDKARRKRPPTCPKPPAGQGCGGVMFNGMQNMCGKSSFVRKAKNSAYGAKIPNNDIHVCDTGQKMETESPGVVGRGRVNVFRPSLFCGLCG